MRTTTAVQYVTTHPVPAVLVSTVALGLAFLLIRALGRGMAAGARPIRTAAATTDRSDLLTYLAASIATGVAAQGMWRFFGDVLHFEPVLRAGMFAFLEIAVLTSAVRARGAMREHGSAGVDGAAVWVLTGLSASMSAMDARSFPEALFRLAAPLVAAWLWERGMAVERRRLTGLRGIHWRVTPERVMVRLGLAEPTGRTAGQVDATRYLTRLALAAKKARTTTAAGGTGRRHQYALRRLDAAMRQAVTHTDLPADPAQQQQLLAQLAALTNVGALLTLDHPAPWGPAPEPEGQQDRQDRDRGQGEQAKPKRPATRRRAGGVSVAVKVARLRVKYPDWTVAQIAEKAGMSERNARRHLNAAPAGQSTTAVRRPYEPINPPTETDSGQDGADDVAA